MTRTPIPDFMGYHIGEDGSVYSDRSSKVLKAGRCGAGYLFVVLRRDGRSRPRMIHRLVLETYVGPCPDGMECCHNNGDRDDNRLENLRWDTRKANRADSQKHGTWPQGPGHTNCKLTEQQIRQMIYTYKKRHASIWRSI